MQADGGIRAALLLALRLTLLVVSIPGALPAEETARLRPYAAAVCLLAGLVRVELPFGVPLSVVGAAAVCLLVEDAQDALLIGAACGLVLDLGSLPSPPQTACFCLPLLVCRMADLRRTARAAAFAGLYFLCVLVWGGEHAGWTLGVLAGAVFSCLLPGFALPDARRDAPAAASTLVQTADVLQRMETKLSLSGQEAQTAPALIFDSAADDVCRSCVKHQQCWQERADDTCRLLSACAGTILRQGQANEGDLPAGFCAVCIREEAFRAAINRRCAPSSRSCWPSGAARRRGKFPARCSVSLRAFYARRARSAPPGASRAIGSRSASGRSGCGAIRSAATAGQASSAA